MANLVLYNTLTRKKEQFKPLKDKKVGLYACGPTVYDFAHIGNFRTYIFEDILVRVLHYNNYNVKHVMNITDVGHLVSDADEGEDKMMKALKREGLKPTKESMLKIAEMYTKAFKQDMKDLNLVEPDIWCKATEHIKEMINLVKTLEKKGYTYKTSDGIYFNTNKFDNYLKLTGQNPEELKAGARIEMGEKKNPTDFALWIFAIGKHKNQIMTWDSPWGKGFPGWHIECSAMAMKYLGNTLDIHCGGIDHIPVHHTNEIAQSEASTGKQFARWWIHGEFLQVNLGKMAKSAGTFIILKDIKEKGFDPLAYKYLTYQTHYRTPLNFTWESLESAQNAFENLKTKILEIKEKTIQKDESNDYVKQFNCAINDDLNIPKALGVMNKLLKSDLTNKQKYATILRFDKIFGLNLDKVKSIKIPDSIKKLAKERELARANKDFKKADKIRDKIENKGYLIEDSATGPKIKLK